MKKDSYCASDFNLFLASDSVLAALESLHQLIADIPAEEPERTLWFNTLSGLVRSGRQSARALNLFLNEAGDRHRFPSRWADLTREADDEDWHGVREIAPVYRIR